MHKILFYNELIIYSTIEGLDECMDIVKKISERFNFSFDKCFALQTVLVEALENAFIHGNKGVRELKVRVLIKISKSEIFLEVEDCGDGYDISTVTSTIDGSNFHKESGRGIFFIKRLSSSYCTVGKGNIIRIKLER